MISGQPRGVVPILTPDPPTEIEMARRRLGKTDIEVTSIGLGCWQFSGQRGLAGRYWQAVPQDEVDRIVQATLDGGVNWFDTAEAYGNGHSEESLSAALQVAGVTSDDVVVATKWMPFFRTARSISKTIGERKRHLAPYVIDLHQIHSPYGALSSKEQQLDAMADLVASRQVRSVGVSNYDADAMRRAHGVLARRGVPLASNQVKYSLLDRRVERKGVVAAAQELGITVIAYSPLEQGLLTGKFHEDPSRISGPRRWMPLFRDKGMERTRPVIDRVRAIAEAHGASPAQVALAWVVQFFGDTVVAIPGASKVSQARQNAGVLDLELTPQELADLDAVSRPFL